MTLTDQFGQTNATVVSPTRLCNPADKNGEGITDQTAHLMCYKTHDTGPIPTGDVIVGNQFGEQRLRVLVGDSLCAPAEKNGVALSPEASASLNHYRCYRVQPREPFTPRTVALADQFETRTVTVGKPLLLCNPVDKNGEGIPDPTCHLTCFKMLREEPPFGPVDVDVSDQFAQMQNIRAFVRECRKVALFCEPSSKRFAP